MQMISSQENGQYHFLHITAKCMVTTVFIRIRASGPLSKFDILRGGKPRSGANLRQALSKTSQNRHKKFKIILATHENQNKRPGHCMNTSRLKYLGLH